VSWVVVADPDGHEFYVLQALTTEDRIYEGLQAQSAPSGSGPG
jgi:hypothetical protein